MLVDRRLDGRHRLSIYEGVGWGELYDVERDANEVDNLWDDQGAHRLRWELTERLARAMIELSETSPYPTQIA